MTIKHYAICDKCGKTVKAEMRKVAPMEHPWCISVLYAAPKGWMEYEEDAGIKHFCKECTRGNEK